MWLEAWTLLFMWCVHACMLLLLLIYLVVLLISPPQWISTCKKTWTLIFYKCQQICHDSFHLLDRKDTKVLYLRNSTKLPVAWRLSGLEMLGEDFTVGADTGVVQPLSEYPLQAYFRAMRPVQTSKRMIRLEVGIQGCERALCIRTGSIALCTVCAHQELQLCVYLWKCFKSAFVGGLYKTIYSYYYYFITRQQEFLRWICYQAYKSDCPIKYVIFLSLWIVNRL